MSSDMDCRKKDKRLLVLLAFGVFVLLPDIRIHETNEPVSCNWYWLESGGGARRFFRSDQAGLRNISQQRQDGRDLVAPQLQDAVVAGIRETGAVSFRNSGDASAELSAPSPRLSFLLGRPLPVNSADEADLALIPGIGPVLAAQIVRYRERHGPITGPEQLTEVPGIGPALKNRLQDYFIYTTIGDQH